MHWKPWRTAEKPQELELSIEKCNYLYNLASICVTIRYIFPEILDDKVFWQVSFHSTNILCNKNMHLTHFQWNYYTFIHKTWNLCIVIPYSCKLSQTDIQFLWQDLYYLHWSEVSLLWPHSCGIIPWLQRCMWNHGEVVLMLWIWRF